MLHSILQQGWNVFHDLDECFRSYFRISKMVDDNQVHNKSLTNFRVFSSDSISKWFCPKCQQKRDSEHGLAIYSPPPFLCVNLKRFSNDVEKINHHVRFPEHLNLEPYLDALQEDGIKKSSRYKLSGVVVHHGLTIRDGHYISYVRHL
jgi:ubiquitin C-terminal hydrolase